MYCINCGTKLPDNARFCSACGTNVSVGDKVATKRNEPLDTSPTEQEAEMPSELRKETLLKKPKPSDRDIIAKLKAIFVTFILALLLWIWFIVVATNADYYDIKFSIGFVIAVTVIELIITIPWTKILNTPSTLMGNLISKAILETLDFVPSRWRKDKSEIFWPIIGILFGGLFGVVIFWLRDEEFNIYSYLVFWAWFSPIMFIGSLWFFSLDEIIQTSQKQYKEIAIGAIKGIGGLIIGASIAIGVWFFLDKRDFFGDLLRFEKYNSIDLFTPFLNTFLGIVIPIPAAIIFKHFDSALLQLRYWGDFCAIQARETFEETKDYNRAIRLCTEALSADPQNEFAFLTRAKCYWITGNYEHATSDLDLILKSRSKDKSILKRAHQVSGLVYFDIGNFNEAIQSFTNAIQVDKKFVPAYQRLSQSFQADFRYDEAIAAINKAIKIERKNPRLISTRGRIYLEIGLYKEALDDFEMAFKLKKYIQYLYNMFLAYHVMGKSEESQELITTIIEKVHQWYKKNPQDWGLDLALYLLSAGKEEETERLYKEEIDKKVPYDKILVAAQELEYLARLQPSFNRVKEMSDILNEYLSRNRI